MRSMRFVRNVFLLVLAILFFTTTTKAQNTLLGETYTTKTQDGVTLYLLRYHPPYKTVNNNTQPILLFPGITCNMEEFLEHTPSKLKKLYSKTKILPDTLANWAKGDNNIKKDHMLYYSLAYYLWKKGYDVWLVNYRGTGIKGFKSNVGSWFASLDTWALYDAPAAIEKVYNVTGKHPIIGGHSTGGLVSYEYLQGAKFKKTWKCYFGIPWCRKVVSDNNLAKERNNITQGPQTVLGVIALDPAVIPPLPKYLNNPLLWSTFYVPLYIDVRKAVAELAKNDPLWNSTMKTFDSVVSSIFYINKNFGKYSDFIRDITFIDPNDLNDALNDFLARYIFDSFYNQMFAQYGDFGLNHTVREYFKNNGKGYLIAPPKPKPGKDGYYYYLNNMKKVQVPFITILSEYDGLVSANEVISDLMYKKTPSPYDEYYIIEGTAHVDLPFGLKAPKEIFTKIGKWLNKIRKYPITPHN